MARKNTSKTASIAAFANLVHLTTAVHVALFNEILLPEINKEGGRWFAVRTKDHHLPFLEAGAIITPEGALPGLQFVARKKNYNFNDSNWVGQDVVLAKLLEVADKANPEKKHTKKDMYFFLEDIKNILKNSAFVPTTPVTEEAPVQEEPATQPAE